MPEQSSQEFLRELDRKLWAAADKLRANLDAAVYKHAVLGLIFEVDPVFRTTGSGFLDGGQRGWVRPVRKACQGVWLDRPWWGRSWQ
jgi:hypothetical protein